MKKFMAVSFLLPSTFFLVVSLFYTLLPLWIEVVKGIVHQLTNSITISTIPLVISAYFLRLEVISNSIVQRMCKYSTTGDALGQNRL